MRTATKKMKVDCLIDIDCLKSFESLCKCSKCSIFGRPVARYVSNEVSHCLTAAEFVRDIEYIPYKRRTLLLLPAIQVTEFYSVVTPA